MTKIEKRLADLKARQEDGTYTLCPRCGKATMKPDLYTNALSRLADVMVCDVCGVDEAKLAWMRSPGTLYDWAALQPERPASDFKALPPETVRQQILDQQSGALTELFKRAWGGEDSEAVRYDAFEICPGLTELWTEPFQAKYEARGGAVLVRFREAQTGIQIASDIIGK